MPKNLVIVESPAKAQTIGKFLGSDYQVKSSFGHIRDLPKKELGVEIDKGFKPTYVIEPDKKKIVAELKKSAAGSVVWLASDEDREGEAIAWHVCHALELDPATTNRIAFHEITKPAIEAAIKNPKHINTKLVDAQQARRILDRLVGYELSPVLWKKVRAGLSAGRVQSVAVRLIVEREREIKDFKAVSSFKLTAVFKVGDQELLAELLDKLEDEAAAKDFLNSLIKASFSVGSIKQKPGLRSPAAPFTTSTLQQEASRRLGYSVRQTMVLAQKLYENGDITYMRTDSLNLSNIAITAAQKYITDSFGSEYTQVRQYKTKSRLAQEAHEAIRPTHLPKLKAGADSRQQKLYELIWRRTVASQMAPAKLEKTEVSIDISGRSEKLMASGEILQFDGFLKVYGGGKDDKILPPIKEGQTLELGSANALQTFSRPAARYSEAALVKKLEELGIGRPSTYAPTIGTIQERGYIVKSDIEGEPRALKQISIKAGQITDSTQDMMVGADRSKLIPTELAEIVNDFLLKYFSEIIDYDFTARAEEEFDDIAEGKLAWNDMLEKFYKRFHPLLEKSNDASRAEAMKVRELGKDPASKEPIYARFGRYGPVLQMGETPKTKAKTEPKPRFAPFPAGLKIEDVTLEQALPMFKLPRTLGKTSEGDDILTDIGPYGPYVKVGKKFISLKDHDPLTISLQQAQTVIEKAAKNASQKVIAEFGSLKILRGPYGPYVSDGKKNARIPKNQDPEKLSEAEALSLLEKKASSPRRNFKRK